MTTRTRKRTRYSEDSDYSDVEDENISDQKMLNDLRCNNRVAYDNFQDTKLEILKAEPKLTQILQEPLLIKDRARLLQLYEIYKLTASASEDWLNLRQRVNDLFDECKNNFTQHSKYTKQQHVSMKNQLDILENYDPNVDLKYKILQLNTSLDNKKVIYSRYKQMQNTKDDDEEKSKLKNWLNWAISIPHDEIRTFPFSKIQLTNFLLHVSEMLNKELYGMEPVKEQILLFVSAKIQNPSMKRCSFGIL